MSIIDIGHAVREGEELYVNAIENWLIEQDIELVGPVEVTQYSGGVSNWTYRLKYQNIDLILRRPPAGTKTKLAYDMSREYHIQKALKEFYPTVPEIFISELCLSLIFM